MPHATPCAVILPQSIDAFESSWPALSWEQISVRSAQHTAPDVSISADHQHADKIGGGIEETHTMMHLVQQRWLPLVIISVIGGVKWGGRAVVTGV